MNFDSFTLDPDSIFDPVAWQTPSFINPQLIFVDPARNNEKVENSDAISDTSDGSDTPLAWRACSNIITSPSGLKAEMNKIDAATITKAERETPPCLRPTTKTISCHHSPASLSSSQSDPGEDENDGSDYISEPVPRTLSKRPSLSTERKVKASKKKSCGRDGPRRRSQNVNSQQKYRNKIKALRSLSDDFVATVKGLTELDPPTFQRRVLEELDLHRIGKFSIPGLIILDDISKGSLLLDAEDRVAWCDS
ncbi:MAG: hypothetical protein TREMPRED_001406 [Tremellales sp. Tagirdzhanova-0007]|nr:MAG: hypothetical protein TREMPRED_001406 [Tremellales sp. Tagirdzhanova-0007]